MARRTHVIGTPDDHDRRLDPRLGEQDLPRRVPAQTNAQHEILRDRRMRRGSGLEDVAPQMVDQQTDIGGRAVEHGEHVLGVALVAVAPAAVRRGVDEARAVVALVEGHGEEAVGGRGRGRARAAAPPVPRVDAEAADGEHGLGLLQARVQQPEHGDGVAWGGELGEAEDVREDAGDVECLGGDGGVVCVRRSF